MFSIFGSKKKKSDTVGDLLTEFFVYQQLRGRLAKIQSLQKLNRVDEAREVLVEAERLAKNYLAENPQEKKAHMMLALLYSETGQPDRAESILQALLDSTDFQLTAQERLVLSAAIQKIRRERPRDQASSAGPEGFTQVYCCSNCGRLHNFVSMPCPNCDWSPETIEETARSIVLSTSHFKIPALLTLSREIAKGRAAAEVVPNLRESGIAYLGASKQRQIVEQVFALLTENKHKNHRSLPDLRRCSACGERVLFSGAEECERCGHLVDWPGALRALACLDNLLWLFEQRVEVSSTDAFSEFVRLLVAMTNNLLRKQETPSPTERQYALKLLAELGAVCDLNRGAIVETKNPKELKIYLVKDSMLEDSEMFGLFLLKELELFAVRMVDGVDG